MIIVIVIINITHLFDFVKHFFKKIKAVNFHSPEMSSEAVIAISSPSCAILRYLPKLFYISVAVTVVILSASFS